MTATRLSQTFDLSPERDRPPAFLIGAGFVALAGCASAIMSLMAL